MFSGFFNNPLKKITFEDLQYAIKNKDRFIIINTLAYNEQNCLIINTVPYQMEENTINEILNQYAYKDKIIIVYGKNTNDDTVEKKYKQLLSLGFTEVYIYLGGMFEWMLLQDIYGKEEFPTTSKVLDILKYKGVRIW
jgi:rhodanese-related sulfurtransferase|uniref:Rhodanese domain-containing protein n=1 Tax=viral metagenome TaxID=1070528 RepID=A0A6C0JQS1_9ZZZZ